MGNQPVQEKKAVGPLKEPSLFTRLGGTYAIAAVVNDFSDALLTNPVVGVDSPNPYLRDWSRNKLDRLPGLKFQRTAWLISLAGGPYVFAPTKPGQCPFSLENAHGGFQISPAEFDAVATELRNSMDKFKVPQKEQQEVLAVFSAHKNEVNAGYFLAHGIPAPTIICPNK